MATNARVEVWAGGRWLGVRSITAVRQAPSYGGPGEEGTTVFEPVPAKDAAERELASKLEVLLAENVGPLWLTLEDGQSLLYAGGAAGPLRVAEVSG